MKKCSAWAGRLAAAVRWLALGSPVLILGVQLPLLVDGPLSFPSHMSISYSGFGSISRSCSRVTLPVGGLLESGGLCCGCSAASRWMALDSGRSCVPHFFVDNLLRVPPVMSGLHVWWSGRPLFFYISNLHKNKKGLRRIPHREASGGAVHGDARQSGKTP